MTNTINCDHCGHEIDIDQAINSKLQADFDAKNKLLDEKEQTLEAKTIKANQEQEEIIESRVKEEKALFSKTVKSDYEANFKLEMKEANDVRLELIKLKRINIQLDTDNKIADGEAKLEIELRVTEATRLANQKADERAELIQKENEVKFKQLKKTIERSSQQVSQGSIQLQGEAYEACLESFLDSHFKHDVIQPIKQGAYGADVLLKVVDSNKSCGSIYFEGKRTKTFSHKWIAKFKSDIRAHNANVGVLVTAVLPNKMIRGGLVEGVWVVTLEEFKIISHVLRSQLVQIEQLKRNGQDQKGKAAILYNYVCSDNFLANMDVIVEGFKALKTEIDSEKLAMNRIWAKRTRHLESIMLSSSSIYGSFQGIDSSIQTVKGLELGDE